MTLDVIKDIFGGILSNSTISGGVVIFGGVPVGGGIVILPGVGAPHQPHPPGGVTIGGGTPPFTSTAYPEICFRYPYIMGAYVAKWLRNLGTVPRF